MTARSATTRAAGEFCWVDLWEVAVGVPDLTVVAQRVATSSWVADSTELRLTDPQGLRLVVVRA